MQNRYTGDIGDFVKYGLLRAITAGRNLGVAWYLFPDESHNLDGKHIDYLKHPERWRHFDPMLFDVLAGIVENHKRHVSNIEQSRILGNACFSGVPLDTNITNTVQRRQWRANWFKGVQESLRGCDIVFANPDNRLCEEERFRPGRTKDWKRIPLFEAQTLAEGRTAIIYHHNTRRKGGHVEETIYWIDQLGEQTQAIRWRQYSNRTFFIVNPDNETIEAIENFAKQWGLVENLFRKDSK